jgi:hypothetical protein
MVGCMLTLQGMSCSAAVMYAVEAVAAACPNDTVLARTAQQATRSSIWSASASLRVQSHMAHDWQAMELV